MSRLSHPNIIRLIGFVEDIEKGDAWMILPWEENGNVREFLQSGQWDIPERISLLQDIANGLEYLHTQQPPICHGDLKSFNILVNTSYHAIITDFGSARVRRSVTSERKGKRPTLPDQMLVNPEIAAELISPQVIFNSSTSDLTLTGSGLSLRWAAPEVLRDGMQDLPGDIWAMGWICWEVVTGKIPFDELNQKPAIILHTISGKLPAIRKDTDLSHILELCGLMSDCWISEPDKRVTASTFQRKVGHMPSITPSCNTFDGQKLRSVGLLLELGRMYEQQRDGETANLYYQLGLNAATRTRNKAGKASALLCLGDLYRLRSKYPEAEQALTDAHKLYSCVGGDWGAAAALGRLGLIYYSLSKYGEAEKMFTEANEINSRIGDDIGVAHSIEGLGDVYLARSKHREAEKAFTEAHEIYSRIGHDMGVANTLISLGRLYGQQSSFFNAEHVLMEARSIQSHIGDDNGTALTVYGLGDIYRAQSKHHEAEKAFTEAHEIFSRIGNNLGVANALTGLGQIYHSQARSQAAEKASYKIYCAVGSDTANRNEFQAAEKAFNDAYKIYSAIGVHNGTGNVFRCLGMVYSHLGRYDEAEVSFHKALAAYELVDGANSRAQTLLALGGLMYDLQRYREAEEAVTEALAIIISLRDERGQVGPLLILWRIFAFQSRHNDQMNALMQLEALLSRHGEDRLRAETLINLGQVHITLRLYQEAEEYCLLAQAICLSLQMTHQEANALLGLGASYLGQDRYGEGEECFARAGVIFAIFGDEEGEAKASDGSMFAMAWSRARSVIQGERSQI